MTRVLQRITTQFSPEEDRIRLAGAAENGTQAVIWLTRRLLGLLVPVLLKQLDEQFAGASPAYRQALQEFAQQAACDALGGSKPVHAGQDDETLVATAVDVGRTEFGALLTLRDQSGRAFALPLSKDALRQWLHILYQTDRKAGWQLPQWPDWLTGGGAGTGTELPLH